MNQPFQKPVAVLASIAGLGAFIAAGVPVWSSATPLSGSHKTVVVTPSSPDSKTTTPIKHLVVIFQENVSFDHYY